VNATFVAGAKKVSSSFSFRFFLGNVLLPKQMCPHLPLYPPVSIRQEIYFTGVHRLFVVFVFYSSASCKQSFKPPTSTNSPRFGISMALQSMSEKPHDKICFNFKGRKLTLKFQSHVFRVVIGGPGRQEKNGTGNFDVRKSLHQQTTVL